MKNWIAVLLMLSFPVAAESLTEKQKEALSNVEMELSMCIAYFGFAKQCAPEGAKEQAKAFDPTIDFMMSMAFKIGQSIGMTEDAMLARMKLAADQEGDLIAGKCVNFSSLLMRYAARCKKAGENLDSIYNEYME